MITIKRETFRGRYFVVARDPPTRKGLKGKVQDRKKWGKNFQLPQARILFKKSMSFSKGVSVQKLAKVKEVSDFRKDFRIPAKQVYQFVVEAVIKGEKITARSRKHERSFPVSLARKEALESFHERVAQKLGFDYEARLGISALEKMRRPPEIREGIVYYKKL